MALNREDKRKLAKEGDDGADDETLGTGSVGTKTKESRVGAVQFTKEVRSELRKVAWPTRSETINYGIIVLVSLIFMTTFIFLIDLFFAEMILRLFNAK